MGLDLTALALTKGVLRMANQSYRLPPDRLQADRVSFRALQAVEGYAPANGAYALEEIERVHAELESLRVAEVQAEVARVAARDRAAAKEWEFHRLVMGAKDQVVAQFGRDSNEVQAVGLKKSSERKRPRPRAAKGSAPE